MGLLYRYGGLTHEQLERVTGRGPSAVDRQLRPLLRSGRVLQARDKAVWQSTKSGRPKSVYYLGVPAGARTGARALGYENDRAATRDYRRIQLPETAPHRVQANEYLIDLQMAAAAAAGVSAPLAEVYGESCPDLPLFGTAVPKSERKDAPYRFARIVPDGVFALFIGGALQRYYLELETGLRKAAVTAKVVDYMGRWRRLVSPNAGELRFHDSGVRLEPLVVLSKTSEDSEKLRAHLTEKLPEHESWSAVQEALRTASDGAVDPRQLVLLSDFAAATHDPLGRVYTPLAKYPAESGGGRVGLRDAATLAGQIKAPPKKKAKARVDAELEAKAKAEAESKTEEVA